MEPQTFALSPIEKLTVYPDRVEISKPGKTESLPIGQISTVSVEGFIGKKLIITTVDGKKHKFAFRGLLGKSLPGYAGSDAAQKAAEAINAAINATRNAR
jgi:hypothetical protein